MSVPTGVAYKTTDGIMFAYEGTKAHSGDSELRIVFGPAQHVVALRLVRNGNQPEYFGDSRPSMRWLLDRKEPYDFPTGNAFRELIQSNIGG